MENHQLGTLDFIESLARSLNATGLSPRAMTLFRQAKEAIQFRWGRKAKLIAGTCLAVALRQSDRPDCLRDIAYLVEEPFPAVSQAFISVTNALGLTLSRIDSGAYIPILQQHISSLVQGSSGSLPPALSLELSSVSLNAVGNTASSLSDLLARIGTSSVTQYPTPPVACAIFIISLESELRGTLKQLGPLSGILGTRLNVGKGAVMACYKAMQDALASLVNNVPWLDNYETNKGRAKVARRSIVARATKDIISFYDDSWKEAKRPRLDIIDEDDHQYQQRDMAADSADEECSVPRKKRKLQQKGHQAIQFLLDPLTGSLPKSVHSGPPGNTGVHKSTPPETKHPLLTYFLSANATSAKPSRLQLLAAERGGPDGISDDELFVDGELENLMRSEEEIKVIAAVYGWGKEGEVSDSETQVQQNADMGDRRKFTSQNDSRGGEKRSRINLEALARFLNDGDSQDDEPLAGLLGPEFDDPVDGFEPQMEELENQTPEPSDDQLSLACPTTSSEEIVIEDWRPPSPGNCISNERYDEVYD